MRLIDADKILEDVYPVEIMIVDKIRNAPTVDFAIDLDRLKELVEADKEGRCVVLPCKVGDTVYRVLYSCHNADHSEIKRCDECGEECDIEKTIISFIVPDLDWIITNYYAFQNGIWKTTKEEADVERWRG